jgi:hypothetical protein
MWSIRWSTSSGPASNGADGWLEGRVTARGSPPPADTGVDEDLPQRAQYGAVGCGVEIPHDQHRTRPVKLGSGGEFGQKHRLREPVVAVRDAVFEAGDDDV